MMSEYKIHLFSLALAPRAPGANPPPPHPKIEKCSSLADARAVANREFRNYDVIKIFALDNDQKPVEEYRKGVRYVDGRRSPLK